MNKSRTHLLAGVIGGGLEWYDFALYGSFASFIATHFFPANHINSALLGTFGIFAIGFLARPLGAIFFGHYGDRIGRRLPLLIAIVGISLPTLVIGLLPSYQNIGLWAPALLLLARLVQGFMVGGEYTGALLFLAEDAPPSSRAKRASLAMISALGGMLTGSLIASLFTAFFSNSLLNAWVWRVPFCLALPLGALGFYFRRMLVESSVFTAMINIRTVERSPLGTTLRHHGATMLLAIGICALTGTTEYLLFAYLPSFIQQATHVPLATILSLNTTGMVVMLCLLRPMASWSDRIGRRPIVLLSALGFFVLSTPIFYLLTLPHLWAIASGLLIFNILLSMACAPMPALYMELFPTQIRYTGIALSYNLSFALFAGTAPLLAAFSSQLFHSHLAPAAIVMAMAVLSGLCFYFMKESFKQAL